MPASIHTHYSRVIYRCTKMSINCLCRSTVQIHGSNLRVKINGLSGQGDPTHGPDPRVEPVGSR